MISLKLQILLLCITIICFVMLLNMLRRYKIEIKYAMLWICLSLITIILAIFPEIAVFFSELAGIEAPVNMLFLFFISFNLIILFILTTALSRNSNRVKLLVQDVGILKNEISELQNRLEHRGKASDK